MQGDPPFGVGRYILPLLRRRFVPMGEFGVAGAVEIEADHFRAVVHARDKQVRLARGVGVPLHAPGTAADLRLREWGQWFTYVEKSDGVVIAENSPVITFNCTMEVAVCTCQRQSDARCVDGSV